MNEKSEEMQRAFGALSEANQELLLQLARQLEAASLTEAQRRLLAKWEELGGTMQEAMIKVIDSVIRNRK